MSSPFRSFPAIIRAGESLSEEISTHLWVPVAIRLPSNLTVGTRFLTFEAKLGEFYSPVHDDSGDESAVAISQDVVLDETHGLLVGLDVKRNGLEAIRWSEGVKIRTGLRASPTPQDEDTTIIILVKELHLV